MSVLAPPSIQEIPQILRNQLQFILFHYPHPICQQTLLFRWPHVSSTLSLAHLCLYTTSHLSHHHLSLEPLKMPLTWFLLSLLLPQPSIHSPLSSSQSDCLQKQIWCWVSPVYPSQSCCWRGSQPTPALYLAVCSHSVLISHISASNEAYLTRPWILPNLVSFTFLHILLFIQLIGLIASPNYLVNCSFFPTCLFSVSPAASTQMGTAVSVWFQAVFQWPKRVAGIQ